MTRAFRDTHLARLVLDPAYATAYWEIVEEGEKAMEPWLERVMAERAELGERLTKLLTFFSTSAFAQLSPDMAALMLEQAGVMKRYVDVLNRRVELALKLPPPS